MKWEQNNPKKVKECTDILRKGLEITWEEIRVAKNLIRSRGPNDPITKDQCQRAFSYISFLYKLGLISLREQQTMAENIIYEIKNRGGKGNEKNQI